MDKTILIINPGSTSKKYALYRKRSLVATVRIESIGSVEYVATLDYKSTQSTFSLKKEQFRDATSWVVQLFAKQKLLRSWNQLSAIGIRVVAPGKEFQKHQDVTDWFIETLEDRMHQAPLHIKPVLHEITTIKREMPGLRIVAVSDSQIHYSIPYKAKYYGIPIKDAEKWDIKRFGYHGISVSSVVKQLGKFCHTFPEKVVVAHLGGGASITALKHGFSIDTSMGLTPLEGLMMNTRGGDLDDGALLHLAKESGMNLSALEKYLNYKSGLFGVSGVTGDVRQLLELEAHGHAHAHLALEMFIYRVKKYIGSYAIALNGIDVLVFTATIGERSGIMRQRMCSDMEVLGIELDDQKNFEETTGPRWISSTNSKVQVAVIPTDEMGEIHHQTLKSLLH